MKKSLLFISILTALLVIMCVSCKSTPAAATKAEEARQKAIDFDAPAYFPSEWEAAEVHYKAEAWEQATNAYEELFKAALPLYAQAREDEITAIREEIKASGIADAFPEYLKPIDDIALQAQAQYEAQNYYGAKESAAKAMEEYSTLLVGAKAYQARREIIDRGFLQFDRENFERADEVAAQAKTKYEAGDKAGAVESAEEALLRYNIVLSNGWSGYAAERRASAARERDLALEEKANIASRSIFREADVLFNQAEEEYGKENFRNSGLHYVDAEARFAVARKDTEEKRLVAEATIKLAEEKVEASSETAAEAERIIEGGSR
ncbi:MAG: hypothetical protein LBU88_06495 [Treponema sp.]|jgi:hypothetical protein|nr:hypothetical protein [Treponema sp.]